MIKRIRLVCRDTRFLLVPILLLPIASGNAAQTWYEPLDPPRSIQIMLHRGQSDAAPENTIPAMQAAIESGMEWVEVDVRLTRDGHHVILHDDTLDRTTNGQGPVKEKTLDEIQTLDAGSWFAKRYKGETIPDLIELLNFCKGKINVYLDCKDVDPVQLVRDIQATKMESQTVVFGDVPLLKQINDLSHHTIPIMPSINDRLEVAYWKELLDPAAVEIHAELITPELVQQFHDAGIVVQAQVLGERDRPEVWRSCMAMGVDWYQTDFGPEVLAEYTERLTKKYRPVKISAHRGANEFGPENTLLAYRRAIAMGVDYIEIDVRTTRDNRLVSLHDSKLDRTTDGRGALSDCTWDELQTLSAGAWFSSLYREEKIPSLESICELVCTYTPHDRRVGLYVDMKEVAPAPLIELLNKFDLVEPSVFYGSPDELAEVRNLAPKAKLMPGLGQMEDFERILNQLHPYAMDVRWNLLSRQSIQQARERGVLFYSDAMGENERIETYMDSIQWGIETIQTDRIPRVLRAIELVLSAH